LPALSDGAGEEPVALIVVWWLAAMAGAVDACGVSMLKDLYVSFMSGNTTSLGLAIAKSDWARVWLIAGILAAFVGGATAGTVVSVAVGRHHLPVVILIVAALLTSAAAVAGMAILAMTFAMGMLNAAIQHAGQVRISITYVTGILVKLGQGLGLAICGRGTDLAWLKQTVPWTGLLAGAVTATLSLSWYGSRTFVALPPAAILIALGAWSAMRRYDRVE
jgi:uncharacterized membrane protein YoaK (UPF0700 family)